MAIPPRLMLFDAGNTSGTKWRCYPRSGPTSLPHDTLMEPMEVLHRP